MEILKNLSPNELLTLRSRFLRCKNASLTRRAFRHAVQEVAKRNAEFPFTVSRAYLNHLFASVDTEGEGLISWEAFSMFAVEQSRHTTGEITIPYKDYSNECWEGHVGGGDRLRSQSGQFITMHRFLEDGSSSSSSSSTRSSSGDSRRTGMELSYRSESRSSEDSAECTDSEDESYGEGEKKEGKDEEAEEDAAKRKRLSTAPFLWESKSFEKSKRGSVSMEVKEKKASQQHHKQEKSGKPSAASFKKDRKAQRKKSRSHRGTSAKDGLSEGEDSEGVGGSSRRAPRARPSAVSLFEEIGLHDKVAPYSIDDVQLNPSGVKVIDAKLLARTERLVKVTRSLKGSVMLTVHESTDNYPVIGVVPQRVEGFASWTHIPPVSAVANSDVIGTSYTGGLVQLHRLPSPNTLFTKDSHELLPLLSSFQTPQTQTAMEWSRFYNRMFLGSHTGVVSVWDVDAGEKLSSLERLHTLSVTQLHLPSHLLYSASADRFDSLKITDLEKSVVLYAFTNHIMAGIYHLLVDTEFIITSGGESKIVVRHTSSPASSFFNLIDTIVPHQGRVTVLHRLPGSPLLFSGDSRGQVKIWDLRMNSCCQTIAPPALGYEKRKTGLGDEEESGSSIGSQAEGVFRLGTLVGNKIPRSIFLPGKISKRKWCYASVVTTPGGGPSGTSLSSVSASRKKRAGDYSSRNSRIGLPVRSNQWMKYSPFREERQHSEKEGTRGGRTLSPLYVSRASLNEGTLLDGRLLQDSHTSPATQVHQYFQDQEADNAQVTSICSLPKEGLIAVGTNTHRYTLSTLVAAFPDRVDDSIPCRMVLIPNSSELLTFHGRYFKLWNVTNGQLLYTSALNAVQGEISACTLVQPLRRQFLVGTITGDVKGFTVSLGKRVFNFFAALKEARAAHSSASHLSSSVTAIHTAATSPRSSVMGLAGYPSATPPPLPTRIAARAATGMGGDDARCDTIIALDTISSFREQSVPYVIVTYADGVVMLPVSLSVRSVHVLRVHLVTSLLEDHQWSVRDTKYKHRLFHVAISNNVVYMIDLQANTLVASCRVPTHDVDHLLLGIVREGGWAREGGTWHREAPQDRCSSLGARSSSRRSCSGPPISSHTNRRGSKSEARPSRQKSKKEDEGAEGGSGVGGKRKGGSFLEKKSLERRSSRDALSVLFGASSSSAPFSQPPQGSSRFSPDPVPSTRSRRRLSSLHPFSVAAWTGEAPVEALEKEEGDRRKMKRSRRGSLTSSETRATPPPSASSCKSIFFVADGNGLLHCGTTPNFSSSGRRATVGSTAWGGGGAGHGTTLSTPPLHRLSATAHPPSHGTFSGNHSTKDLFSHVSNSNLASTTASLNPSISGSPSGGGGSPPMATLSGSGGTHNALRPRRASVATSGQGGLSNTMAHTTRKGMTGTVVLGSTTTPAGGGATGPSLSSLRWLIGCWDTGKPEHSWKSGGDLVTLIGNVMGTGGAPGTGLHHTGRRETARWRRAASLAVATSRSEGLSLSTLSSSPSIQHATSGALAPSPSSSPPLGDVSFTSHQRLFGSPSPTLAGAAASTSTSFPLPNSSASISGLPSTSLPLFTSFVTPSPFYLTPPSFISKTQAASGSGREENGTVEGSHANVSMSANAGTGSGLGTSSSLPGPLPTPSTPAALAGTSSAAIGAPPVSSSWSHPHAAPSRAATSRGGAGHSFSLPQLVPGASPAITHMFFFTSFLCLVTGDERGVVKLWDMSDPLLTSTPSYDAKAREEVSLKTGGSALGSPLFPYSKTNPSSPSASGPSPHLTSTNAPSPRTSIVAVPTSSTPRPCTPVSPPPSPPTPPPQLIHSWYAHAHGLTCLSGMIHPVVRLPVILTCGADSHLWWWSCDGVLLGSFATARQLDDRSGGRRFGLIPYLYGTLGKEVDVPSTATAEGMTKKNEEEEHRKKDDEKGSKESREVSSASALPLASTSTYPLTAARRAPVQWEQFEQYYEQKKKKAQEAMEVFSTPALCSLDEHKEENAPSQEDWAAATMRGGTSSPMAKGGGSSPAMAPFSPCVTTTSSPGWAGGGALASPMASAPPWGSSLPSPARMAAGGLGSPVMTTWRGRTSGASTEDGNNTAPPSTPSAAPSLWAPALREPVRPAGRGSIFLTMTVRPTSSPEEVPPSAPLVHETTKEEPQEEEEEEEKSFLVSSSSSASSFSASKEWESRLAETKRRDVDFSEGSPLLVEPPRSPLPNALLPLEKDPPTTVPAGPLSVIVEAPVLYITEPTSSKVVRGPTLTVPPSSTSSLSHLLPAGGVHTQKVEKRNRDGLGKDDDVDDGDEDDDAAIVRNRLFSSPAWTVAPSKTTEAPSPSCSFMHSLQEVQEDDTRSKGEVRMQKNGEARNTPQQGPSSFRTSTPQQMSASWRSSSEMSLSSCASSSSSSPLSLAVLGTSYETEPLDHTQTRKTEEAKRERVTCEKDKGPGNETGMADAKEVSATTTVTQPVADLTSHLVKKKSKRRHLSHGGAPPVRCAPPHRPPPSGKWAGGRVAAAMASVAREDTRPCSSPFQFSLHQSFKSGDERGGAEESNDTTDDEDDAKTQGAPDKANTSVLLHSTAVDVPFTSVRPLTSPAPTTTTVELSHGHPNRHGEGIRSAPEHEREERHEKEIGTEKTPKKGKISETLIDTTNIGILMKSMLSSGLGLGSEKEKPGKEAEKQPLNSKTTPLYSKDESFIENEEEKESAAAVGVCLPAGEMAEAFFKKKENAKCLILKPEYWEVPLHQQWQHKMMFPLERTGRTRRRSERGREDESVKTYLDGTSSLQRRRRSGRSVLPGTSREEDFPRGLSSKEGGRGAGDHALVEYPPRSTPRSRSGGGFNTVMTSSEPSTGVQTIVSLNPPFSSTYGVGGGANVLVQDGISLAPGMANPIYSLPHTEAYRMCWPIGSMPHMGSGKHLDEDSRRRRSSSSYASQRAVSTEEGPTARGSCVPPGVGSSSTGWALPLPALQIPSPPPIVSGQRRSCPSSPPPTATSPRASTSASTLAPCSSTSASAPPESRKGRRDSRRTEEGDSGLGFSTRPPTGVSSGAARKGPLDVTNGLIELRVAKQSIQGVEEQAVLRSTLTASGWLVPHSEQEERKQGGDTPPEKPLPLSAPRRRSMVLEGSKEKDSGVFTLSQPMNLFFSVSQEVSSSPHTKEESTVQPAAAGMASPSCSLVQGSPQSQRSPRERKAEGGVTHGAEMEEEKPGTQAGGVARHAFASPTAPTGGGTQDQLPSTEGRPSGRRQMGVLGGSPPSSSFSTLGNLSLSSRSVLSPSAAFHSRSSSQGRLRLGETTVSDQQMLSYNLPSPPFGSSPTSSAPLKPLRRKEVGNERDLLSSLKKPIPEVSLRMVDTEISLNIQRDALEKLKVRGVVKGGGKEGNSSKGLPSSSTVKYVPKSFSAHHFLPH